MSQHDYIINNATFPNVRSDLNLALGAVATNNAGDDAPSTTYANQWWFDSNGNTLYLRNKDNDAWVTILTIGATSDTVTSVEGASSLAGIDDQSSSNDDQITITDTAVIINQDSDDLDFIVESNGNANMLFVDGGNDKVGIGTGTPAKLVHIVGAADNGILEGIQIDNTDHASTETGQAVAINLRLSQAGTMRDAGRITIGKDDDWDDAAATDSHITFKTMTSNTLTEHMRITSAGRVGVGTNAPDMLLDVTGVISAGAGTDEDLQQWNIGSDNVKAKMTYLDASSNRGLAIGTSTGHDFFLRTNNNIGLKVDYAGHVTMPLQPAFLAVTNQNHQNVADGFVTVGANHEMFDQNSDYNTSTYHFTAPVTGRYVLFGKIAIEQMPNDYHWIYAGIGTSNRTHYGDLIDPREILSNGDTSSGSSHSLSVQILADLDANDTAYLFLRSSAHGTNIMDITNTGTVNPDTFFSGYLAC